MTRPQVRRVRSVRRSVSTTSGSSTLRARRVAHVEHVDDARARACDLGDPHVEVEIGERRREPVQQTDVVVGVHLDDGVGIRLVGSTSTRLPAPGVVAVTRYASPRASTRARDVDLAHERGARSCAPRGAVVVDATVRIDGAEHVEREAVGRCRTGSPRPRRARRSSARPRAWRAARDGRPRRP